MKSRPMKTLLVSILTLGRPQNVERQLLDLPGWLNNFSTAYGIAVHIVVRNNDPRAAFESVSELMERLQLEYDELQFICVSGEANTGFGRGHNENYRLCPCDGLLILNDDIGLPHIDWLAQAVALLGRADRTAFVGASENPQYLSPFFGNGTFPAEHQSSPLKYAEASVMLVDGQVFTEIGMFSDKIEWAMCEDADLSLRAQQHGYKLAWLPIPHEHWRSSTFNSLPSAVRSSILEHNRATLFAAWRHTFSTGRIGRYDVFDLWSDGVGDVFCALPHLAAELARMTPSQRRLVVVNTRMPELIALLGHAEPRVVSYADPIALHAALADEGIASLRSMRAINYSLPFEIHALISGALSLTPATPQDHEAFRARLRDSITTKDLPGQLTPGAYCVVHLEFLRTDHHGRALSLARAQELVRICSELFDTVVLIGKLAVQIDDVVPPAVAGGGRHNIVDLQGKLAGTRLIPVLAHAGFFVGIDSYPSHVAQAAGVPSAIFFGSVHPLTRVWNERLAWPLSAALDCIGCYHTHIELSVPFCMRLDEACTTDLDAATMRETVRAMIAGAAFDWSAARNRLRKLQAKMLNLLTHHPRSPPLLFRGSQTGNEQISNMIYEMTDKMAALLRDRYQASNVLTLTSQVADLEAANFTKDAQLEEARRKRAQQDREAARLRAELRQTARRSIHVTPLASLECERDRCDMTIVDQWIYVDSQQEDPQIRLPPIHGLGGRVRLRLSCVAEEANVLEFFWSHREHDFSETMKRTVATGASLVTVDEMFDLVEGERLWIRIDPLAGRGHLRMRGSLQGEFSLSAPPPIPAAADPVQPVESGTPVEYGKPVQPASAQPPANSQDARPDALRRGENGSTPLNNVQA